MLSPPVDPRRAALWTRGFLLLLGSNVAFYMSFQLLLVSMPLYVVHLGGKAATAGLVTGLFTLTAMLVRPLTGWALDAYGRRSIWLLGTLSCVLFVVAQQWAATLVVLIVLRMLNGVGFGVATTAGGTIAADMVPKTRLGEGMGFFGVTMGIPLAVAPPLGLWLVGRGDYADLFWLGALFTAVSLALAAILRAPVRDKREAPVGRSRLSSMFERTALYPSALMFLLISSFGLILALLALYGKERGLGSVGIWFTVYAVILTLARSVGGRLSDRIGYRQTAVAGFVFAGVGLVAIAMSRDLPLLLASAVLYGIGYGTTQPSLQAMVVGRAPMGRVGAATAVLFFSYDLGTTVGSVGGGLLAGVIGMGGTFAFSAVGPLIGTAVLVGDIWRRGRIPRPPLS
jgi:MFS family permease